MAVAAVKEYAQVEDIFALAADRGEPPFLIAVSYTHLDVYKRQVMVRAEIDVFVIMQL